MSEPARRWISAEEYLALEEQAEHRSEYFDGEIFAMAGGTLEHNLISSNVLYELRNQMGAPPCLALTSDQRLKVSQTGLYTYPDAVVVCGRPELDGIALLNPTLIVEVLSDSTEAYDRDDKFGHYRTLASLREYVLVASRKPQIERYTRSAVGGDDWILSSCSDPEGVLELPSIGSRLRLPQVYQDVEFPPAESGKRRGPRTSSGLEVN
ncbi:MAG: Uma2 family endonuclease [Actinomycetota bacterium]